MENQNIHIAIQNIEHKWLNVLYKSCIKQFVNIHLPSHDADHHLRVWGYAKELISAIHLKGIPVNEAELEQLIVAVFFHDQGMSLTFSPEHGKMSRTLCSAFFQEKLLTPAPIQDFDSVLAAIEMPIKKITHQLPSLKILLTCTKS